jgi:hypothetical protein
MIEFFIISDFQRKFTRIKSIHTQKAAERISFYHFEENIAGRIKSIHTQKAAESILCKTKKKEL